MKLATFTHQQHTRMGAVVDDEIVDSADLAQCPQDMIGFLTAGSEARELIANRIEQGRSRLALQDVQLHAPVMNPQKFLALGLNYAEHISETGMQRPEFPSFFNKQISCVNGPYDPIYRPHVSAKLDYEGELGFVIGQRCHNVPREAAHKVIAGFVVVNDVSVRDWQFRAKTMTLGKSFDTHGPFGPWIVTPDEIDNPHKLDVKTWVSGELRQSFNTSDQLIDIYDQVEVLSTAFTLMPGDVISTGTGSGVGVKMKPRGYLQVGDTVRVEIEGIGHIENSIVREPGERFESRWEFKP